MEYSKKSIFLLRANGKWYKSRKIARKYNTCVHAVVPRNVCIVLYKLLENVMAPLGHPLVAPLPACTLFLPTLGIPYIL